MYGDDDTFFFTDAVLKSLEGLDPEMPYFLTGYSQALREPILFHKIGHDRVADTVAIIITSE